MPVAASRDDDVHGYALRLVPPWLSLYRVQVMYALHIFVQLRMQNKSKHVLGLGVRLKRSFQVRSTEQRMSD